MAGLITIEARSQEGKETKPWTSYDERIGTPLLNIIYSYKYVSDGAGGRPTRQTQVPTWPSEGLKLLIPLGRPGALNARTAHHDVVPRICEPQKKEEFHQREESDELRNLLPHIGDVSPGGQPAERTASFIYVWLRTFLRRPTAVSRTRKITTYLIF